MSVSISKTEQNQFLDKEMQPILNKLYKEYKSHGDQNALKDGISKLYKLAKSKELTIFQSKKKMLNEIKKDIEEENAKTKAKTKAKVKKFILKCCGAKIYKGEKCKC